MKILQIIPSLHGGGAEKFVIDLSNELSKENEVTICSFHNVTDDMFMAKALESKIRVITLDKKVGLSPSIFFKVYKLIKDENPDIVNTHLRAFFYSSLAVMFSGKKFFHTVHNLAHKESKNIKRIVYKIFFKFFNAIPIAISQEVLKSIQNVYGSNFDLLIENGVKKPEISNNYDAVRQIVNSYKINDETKVFINIGRMSPQKNQKMLIEVFNKLITNKENVSLLIIGEPDGKKNELLKDTLLSLAKNRIHFLGLRENVADFLACADAFCLTSLHEGLPITLLESLAMGVVPICTPAGGIIDVLNNKTGLVTEDFSSDKYLAQIQKFLNLSPLERNVLSKKGKALFEKKYDISRTAKEYMAAYQKEAN